MDITQNIRESIELYRRNFMTLILATLVAAVGSLITAGILAGPLTGGLLMLCLKLMRGEEAGIKEVWGYFDKFAPTFLIVAALWVVTLIAIVLGSIPVVGFIVQILVGPVLGIIFILAVGLVVEQNYEPIAALKKALQWFKTNNPLIIWLYSFVIGLLSGAGAFLFLLPVILTMPLGATGMAIAYRELSNREIGMLTMN
ncbi:MAG: hypothetical protein GX348_02320 [Veillonellaceae bacterium]|jgi:hypothetical protein|nr:hypothetical protein [Veillonellaceae bacterium]